MPLENLLTSLQPLGPIDQANIKSDQDVAQILNQKVAPFSEALVHVPFLLLGRKGSGKSSILDGLRIREKTRNIFSPNPDGLPPKGDPFLINIGSWDRFHSLTLHVSARYSYSSGHLDPDLVPTEYLTTLWQDAFWHEIIMHFYGYCFAQGAHQALLPVQAYVEGHTSYAGPPDMAARRIMDAAKEAILELASARKSHILLLIDSMEKYPVRNVIFSEVLGGLLQAVNNANYESTYLRVTFCLPEEIESHFLIGSSTLLKDLSGAYRIRWKPIDLLKVCAHRTRLFLQIQNKDTYRSTREYNLSTREGVQGFFRTIMPKEFVNSLGQIEDPLAYIIRHTQLLPRHAILIFNAIISRAFQQDSGFARIDSDHIREGVAAAEKLIADQALVPFERIYPKLIQACYDVLPQIHQVSGYGELRIHEKKFKNRIEADIKNVWKTLYYMGIIGTVDTHFSPPSDRYVFASFHFDEKATFGLSHEARYCFHPAFSKRFGVTRRAVDGRKSIYPANVEMLLL